MTQSIDSRDFRRAIGAFATGVTVVAIDIGGEVHAMTANAISSLSLDPLLVLVCVGKRARMSAFLEQATGFSINILREENRALSDYFAGGWKQDSPPPFRFIPWEGGPRLEGCLTAIGCETYRLVEGGDHWIVIGKVVALHQGIEPQLPLLFYSGRYGRLDTAETAPAPDLSQVEVPIHVFYDPWRHDE
jgi:flavin reductase (DIM6/NTAB) family NADH-FMN oxidoreductase RutF